MDYQTIIGELDKLYETPINDGCIAQIPSQLEKLKEIIDVVKCM